MAKKLTEKEEKFAQSYVVHLSVKQAAIDAGYSVKSAQSIGWKILQRPHIQARVSELKSVVQEKVHNRLEITTENILNELARIAFFDIRKLYDEDGRLLPVNELDDDTAAAIAGIEVAVERSTSGSRGLLSHIHKYKANDKKGSLELLGKHKQLFKDRIEHSGGVKIIKDDIE